MTKGTRQFTLSARLHWRIQECNKCNKSFKQDEEIVTIGSSGNRKAYHKKCYEVMFY